MVDRGSFPCSSLTEAKIKKVIPFIETITIFRPWFMEAPMNLHDHYLRANCQVNQNMHWIHTVV